MARNLFVVLVEDFDLLYTSDRYHNAYYAPEKSNELLQVFLHEESAEEAAKDLATRYPTKDVQVFKATHGYIAPTRPVESKVWTPDGKYIPGTP